MSGAIGGVFGFLRWREARELKRMMVALTDELRSRNADKGEAHVLDAVWSESERSIKASDVVRHALGAALAKLPEREKLAIVLHYYEELSAAEIAEVLGVTERAVEDVLDRAILRLKRMGVGYSNSAEETSGRSA